MPQFAYVAVGRDGKKRSGRDFAENRKALEARLRQQKVILLDCREEKARQASLRVTIGLISQLADLVGSGIVIDRALQIISEDATDKRVSALAAGLRDGIKRGQTLSQSLSEAGRFDVLLVPLVRAGEASGQLAEILDILRQHYEQKQSLRREIIGNLAYPIVLVAANLLSLIGLGLYVIPIFKGLFEDRMEALPFSTRAIFWFSDTLVAHGAVLGLGILGILLTIWMLWRNSRAVRETADTVVLGLPVIGPFLGKLEAVNIMTMLSVLLRSGVTLVKALELTVPVVRNSRMSMGMERTLKDLRRGGHFAPGLAAIPAMPKAAQRFVAVGEETGSLGEMCGKAGSQLAKEVQVRMKAMVTLLEPLLIVAMGGLVAFVVVSMLLAVYSMTDIG